MIVGENNLQKRECMIREQDFEFQLRAGNSLGVRSILGSAWACTSRERLKGYSAVER